ncbi:alpha/beta fold hydrolase [Paenibacillus ginsengarvi]|uniref:alpha/beta fold hydrolase n=1 Tax=Paenibacillus ginsengarvi TaxID=400777 RepID=UPI001F01BAF6|nr:alpha/beta fold hydrolase [Paenibacillus ginsengarvi]
MIQLKIFLTGGTGYIGSHILAELISKHHDIIVLVRSLDRFQHTLGRLHLLEAQHVTAVIGDLSKPKLGLSANDYKRIQNSDIIVHAGGPMNIELSQTEAEQAFLNPAIELAELSEKIHMKKGLKQFIHVVGYMSPYNEQNAIHNLDAVLEKAPPYEKMKFQADSYIRKALKPLGIPLSTVNPSTVIGHSYSGITEQIGGLSILVDAVRRNLMPLVPGGKDYWLPMVHIDHVASFIVNLVQTKELASNTYFLLDPKQDSPSIRSLIRQNAIEMRAAPPFGTIPLALLKSLLRLGIGKRLGIPKESMNFLVKSEFPVTSKFELERKNGVRTSVVPTTLPYVIADLDFRLSHPSSEHREGFVQRRRSKLISLEKENHGTPVIFLHGTFSGADCFVPIAKQLNDVNTWLVDLPGFGHSPRHHHPSLMDGYVEAVIEMIHELNRPVILIGHSFGGLIAAKVMERIEQQIRQLLLLQPVLHPIHAKYKYAGVTRSIMKLISRSAFRKTLLKANDFIADSERLDHYSNYVIHDLQSTRIRSTNAMVMSALTQVQSFQLKPELWNAQKVRIHWGDRDAAHHIPERFKHIDTTFIPYGHQYPLEAPHQVAEWLRQVLDLELS